MEEKKDKRAKERLRRTVEELASEEIKKIYQQYSPSLFNFISSKMERREDAEEILQDTWLAILDSLPLFNGRSSFLTWAKSIALHEIADFYRKRKIKSLVFSRLPFLENLVSQALGPELDYQKKETRQEIEKVLSTLSEGYRKILRLKYVEGLSMIEIARALDLSFKSIESRLFRARLAFKTAWQEKSSNSLSSSFSSLALKRRI